MFRIDRLTGRKSTAAHLVRALYKDLDRVPREAIRRLSSPSGQRRPRGPEAQSVFIPPLTISTLPESQRRVLLALSDLSGQSENRGLVSAEQLAAHISAEVRIVRDILYNLRKHHVVFRSKGDESSHRGWKLTDAAQTVVGLFALRQELEYPYLRRR